MANKKDYSDAQHFSRKRLVTAFVSGRPNGRELEPKNYLRSFIAGVAIVILLIAGSLIYGLVKPGLASGWNNNKLIITNNGARYITKNSVLYPVINLSSAKLAIPSSEFQKITTDEDKLVGFQHGQTLGIQGAPETIPSSSNLVKSDWNSCIVNSENITAIGTKNSSKLESKQGQIFTVDSNTYYLILGDGSRYVFVKANLDSVLTKLGFTKVNIVKVTTDWINLFDTSGKLDDQVINTLKSNGISEKKIGVSTVFCGSVDQVEGSPRTILTTSDNLVPDPLFPMGKAAVFQADSQVFLLDDKLVSYAILDALSNDGEMLKRLGYSTSDILNVPRFWSSLFKNGPVLSESAATSPANSAVTNAADSTSSDANINLKNQETSCQADNKIKNVPDYMNRLKYTSVQKFSTGKGVRIAVIDSGVDKTNPHLSSAIESGGVDLVSDDGNKDGTTDEEGHGTVVAGLIAGREVDGSALIGLAKDSTILPVRVFVSSSANGANNGGPTPEKIAAGIRYAVNAGVNIINLSMSTNVNSDDLKDAVEYASSKGVLIVASSGNRTTSQDQTDSLRYPAAYSGVLGVAAVNNELEPTNDSIHNSAVDIAAPGQAIAAPMKRGIDCSYSKDAASSSFATAFVSATAALLKSETPSLSNSEIIWRLEAASSRSNEDQRDNQVGWGVLNPLESMSIIQGSGNRGPVLAKYQNAKVESIAGLAFDSSKVQVKTDVIHQVAVISFPVTMFILLILGLIWKAKKQSIKEIKEDNNND
ncbi:MAG: type VII secretion protein EccB [Candidatus Ancillula sp.]|jgi:type VII secretion-associated serine protease mycosin|nr:type VII secretion protein EccB [Candidatus Ancillula sp.]